MNSFTYEYQIAQTPFVEKALFSIDLFCIFAKNLLTVFVGSISALSILFHCSVCLSFYQYHTVLITLDL